MPAVENGSFHFPGRAVDATRPVGGSVYLLLIATCLLCAATYFTQVSHWRYVAVVDDLLTAQSSRATQAAWQMTDAGARVAMEQGRPVIQLAATAGAGPPAAWARLSLPPDLQGIQVSVETKADRVVPGRDGWETGRVQINTYDARGRPLWYWPGLVAESSGSTGWLHFAAVIPVTAEVKSVYVVLYNGATSGAMSVRDLHVAGAMERPAFAVLRAILIASWVLLGLWGVWLLVRTRRRRLVARMALLGIMAAALAGILMPQPYLERVSAPIEGLAKSLQAPKLSVSATGSSGATAQQSGRSDAARTPAAGHGAQAFELGLKQAGHFAVFACLAVALGWAFPHLSGLVSGFCLLLFGLATESLQLFLITRSARLTDLAIDATGIAVGLGILVLANWIKAVAPAGWPGNASRGPRP